jgi:uncharacterized protein (UPF0332 family)
VDPELFLSLALTLKSTPGRPEFYRTAISRAYYAAFNVGTQVLATLGIRLSAGPGGHGELRNCLGACGDAGCLKISSRLATLHTRRRAADYLMDDAAAETQKEAELACLDATEILNGLKALRDHSDKAHTRAEMKRVARDTFQLKVS